MGGLRCPKCGRHVVRRAHRTGVVERLLSAVYVFPFHCQLCGRRFRALQWKKRYVLQPAERREVSDRGRVEGEVTGLSVDERPRYRSADFWLAVALLVFLALVVAALIPSFSLCTWGANC